MGPLPYGNPKTLLRSSREKFTADSPVNYSVWGVSGWSFIFRNYTRNVLEVFLSFSESSNSQTPLKTRPLEAAPNCFSSGALGGAGFTSRSRIRVASWSSPGSPGNWYPSRQWRSRAQKGPPGGTNSRPQSERCTGAGVRARVSNLPVVGRYILVRPMLGWPVFSNRHPNMTRTFT